MDYLIYIDTLSMEYPLWILRGLRSQFLKNYEFLSLEIIFILANSTYPDEIWALCGISPES